MLFDLVWTSQDVQEDEVIQGWEAGVSVTTGGGREKDPREGWRENSHRCGRDARKEDTGPQRGEGIGEKRHTNSV